MSKMTEAPSKKMKQENNSITDFKKEKFELSDVEFIEYEPSDAVRIKEEEDPTYVEVYPEIQSLLNDHPEMEEQESDEFKFLCYKCPYEGTCDEDIRNHLIGDHSDILAKENIPNDIVDSVHIRYQEISHTTPKVTKIPAQSSARSGNTLGNLLTSSKNQLHNFVCDQCPFVGENFHLLCLHKVAKHSQVPEDDLTKDQGLHDVKDRMSATFRRFSEKDQMVKVKDQNVGIKEKNQIFQCQYCDFHTHNLSTLCSHNRAKHEKVRYPCAECDYIATSKCHIERHVKSVHEKIPHPCDQCSYTAFDASNLKRHKRNRHATLRCDYCEYTVVTNRLLREHVLSSHKDKLIKCGLCDKRGLEQSLKRHSVKVHGVQLVKSTAHA